MNICCQVSTPEVYRKAGVTSYQDDLDRAFSTLSSWGYEGIELTTRDPKEVNVSLIDSLIKQYSLPVPMICTGELYGQDNLSFADLSDDVRDEAIKRFKEAVELAAHVNADVNLGRIRGNMIPNADAGFVERRIFEALLEVTEFAESAHVTIVLEPVNTLALNYINTTLEGLDLVRKVNSSHFQLMIDTAHLHIEDIDIEHSLKESADHIKYVHVADSNRKYPGAGKFQFPDFFETLKQIGYDGWLGVEVFPVPDKQTAFRQSLRYVRELIAD